MKRYQKKLAQIREILRNNPKGMTITEISKKISTNRNSVAKYLDVLRMSGQLEARYFGPAKVFFLSDRVPLSSILDFSWDYVILLDRSFKIVQVNELVLDVMRKRREDMIGRDIRAIHSSLSKNPELLSKIKHALEGKEDRMELLLQLPKRKICFRTKFIPTTLGTGDVAATLIFEDITKQKTAEEALRQSEAKYRLLVESLNESVWVIDRDAKTTFVNRNMAKMLGYTREQMEGKHISAFADKSDLQLAEYYLKRRKSGIKEKHDVVLITRDGSRIRTTLHASPILNDDGEYIGAVASVTKGTENKPKK